MLLVSSQIALLLLSKSKQMALLLVGQKKPVLVNKNLNTIVCVRILKYLGDLQEYFSLKEEEVIIVNYSVLFDPLVDQDDGFE